MFDEYPVREDALTEMEYCGNQVSLWAPTAERCVLYLNRNEGSASNTFPMEMGENGTWNISIKRGSEGKFYTFNVKVKREMVRRHLGIMAKSRRGKW